jgi:nitroreductase
MTIEGTTISAAQVHAAVEAAGLAPSIHNSQPWTWRSIGDTLELSADLSRALPVIDPDHRQLLVSCGAALLNCWLSLRAAGFDVEVSELPDGPDIGAGRLATLRVSGYRPPTEDETRLAAAITERHTDRRPFQSGEVPVDELRALRHAAEAEGCWLTALTSEDARVELAVLLTRADWAEHHDPDYQAELAAWTRTDPDAVDGIPGATADYSAHPRQADFPLRDFTGGADGAGAEAIGAGAPDGKVEHPQVLVLGTDADGPADRLRAGRALGRVLLAATSAGLATSPLGQAIDIEATRALVRSATGGSGHTQMILRVGYPDSSAAPLPVTKRRPVSEVLQGIPRP